MGYPMRVLFPDPILRMESGNETTALGRLVPRPLGKGRLYISIMCTHKDKEMGISYH